MFIVQDVIVDERIAYIKFACNLFGCKGGCCTIPGGKGAPLLNEEVAKIQRALPIVKKYLSPSHRHAVEINGGIEGADDDYTTNCVENKDCTFVYYEGVVAKCAFEKAYFNNEIDWQKPLSCHLFPIRVSNFGGDVMRYERLEDCKPALIKGTEESIPLYKFLKDALVRTYGLKWYEEFRSECEKLLKNETD